MTKNTGLMPIEIIENKILLLRGKKVMLDRDLANLYGIMTRNLNKAVKRNLERFPDDFMFQLTKDEFSLMFQSGTSKRGGVRKLPYVFTEQGVAMLSSVLNSKRAIRVNIQIMRAFTRLREILMTHKELKMAIDEIIRKQKVKFQDYDDKIKLIFELINKLLEPPESEKKKRIGFLT